VRLVSNCDPAFLEFWHPVARADVLGDGPLHVPLCGRDYVVARLDGELVAFPDVCPHRSFPLSEGAVVSGRLQCPYHGYRFDATGTCVAIPALAPGAPIPSKANLGTVGGVAEHLGLIWLAPDRPRHPLPALPEFFDDRFGHVVTGPFTWKAGAAHMTENFLDVSHFPFVHAGTFGLEADAVMPRIAVTREGLAFRFVYAHQFRNGDEVTELHGAHEPEQLRVMTTDFFPPFGVAVRVDYEETGVVTMLLAVTAPVAEGVSRFFTILLGTDFRSDDAHAAWAFEEKILGEDQVVLERYRDPRMVLDIDREVHTAADRMTVEYRRVLADILRPTPRAAVRSAVA
jgi:vanillate O-demethylase monooxygenase subunit